MKNIFYSVWILLFTTVVFSSCNKETNKQYPSTKRPPVAYAGADKWLVPPADNVFLKGRGTDADGKIISYNWSKVSGASSFTIVNPNAADTKVINLVEGVYEFELTVKDNDGLSAKDNVYVSVYINCPCLPGPCDEAGDPCNPWDY